MLNGPPAAFATGRIAELGAQRAISSNENRDQVKLRFVTVEDLHRGDLTELLAEHLEAVLAAASTMVVQLDLKQANAS